MQQVEQRAAVLELDQEIDVTAGTVVTTGDRTEDCDGAALVPADHLRDLSTPGLDEFPQRAHVERVPTTPLLASTTIPALGPASVPTVVRYLRPMEIRPFAPADTESVRDLWRAADLVRPNTDPLRDIERKMADSPWGFLVLVNGADVIGSVMVGYDGHRGWINYLACHPDHRRNGVATALMEHATGLLLERGCPKVNLQVRNGNVPALRFYERLGFTNDAATSLGLRLIPDN